MLTENDIVKLLSDHLEDNGYKIIQALNTNFNGIDIIADHLKSEDRLYIEAKGETSSKNDSARYGVSFSSNQIKNHIAKAVLASLKVIELKPAGNKTKVAMAFPLTTGHQNEIDKIKFTLKQIGIKVYFVGSDKIIEI